MMNPNSRRLILESLPQTPYDCAKNFYEMFQDEFKFTNNVWYQYWNNEWVVSDSLTVMKKIKNELISEYLSLINFCHQQASDSENETDFYNYLGKSKILSDLTLKLRGISFQDITGSYLEMIMKECDILFTCAEE